MKKRGRETLCTKARTKRLSALLRDGNTIVTVCHAEGIGERTYFDWCERYPAFAAAMRKARAAARIRLVSIIRKAATSNAFHAQWLLERVYSREFARTETRIIEQKAEEPKTVGVNIFYDTQGQGMAELLSFPKHASLVQHERELEQQANVNAADADNGAVTNAAEPDDAVTDAISDGPPPQVVDKRLTGRIRPEWKSNNGQP
jgi:hypothetical protein